MSEKTDPIGPGPARALYYVAPQTVELRPADVGFMAEQRENEQILVRTLWSGISRGTERLVFEGAIPESEYSRMRAPHQEGEFPFPVKYGYAAVGVVEDGPADLLGKRVFSLYPHQTQFVVDRQAAMPLPNQLPARRGILAANMETALNAVWDGAPSAGDKIVVVGAGAVGLLVASLAARLPGAEVIVCDTNPAREGVVRALGAAFMSPGELGETEADVVFHTSATGAGLATSLRAAGFEARIIELSWYGAKEIGAHLGSSFHSKRLKLLSSQVGSIAEARRSRWTYARRLAKALALLADDRLDALITNEVAFDALPENMASIFDSNSPEIVTAVRYE